MTKAGGLASKPFIEWEGRPDSFALVHPYIIAVENDLIEIRHIETGALEQLIFGDSIQLLYSDVDLMGKNVIQLLMVCISSCLFVSIVSFARQCHFDKMSNLAPLFAIILQLSLTQRSQIFARLSNCQRPLPARPLWSLSDTSPRPRSRHSLICIRQVLAEGHRLFPRLLFHHRSRLRSTPRPTLQHLPFLFDHILSLSKANTVWPLAFPAMVLSRDMRLLLYRWTCHCLSLTCPRHLTRHPSLAQLLYHLQGHHLRLAMLISVCLAHHCRSTLCRKHLNFRVIVRMRQVVVKDTLRCSQ